MVLFLSPDVRGCSRFADHALNITVPKVRADGIWRNHRRDFIGNAKPGKLSPDPVLPGFCGCHSFRAGCSREDGARRRIRPDLFKLYGSTGEVGFRLGDACSFPAGVSGVRSMDMVYECPARPETGDYLRD